MPSYGGRCALRFPDRIPAAVAVDLPDTVEVCRASPTPITAKLDRPRTRWRLLVAAVGCELVKTAFLASKHLSGLSCVLPRDPEALRTVFIPTAGGAHATGPWIDRDRNWLISNGFVFSELDLAVSSSTAEVVEELSEADLIVVAGGNTYFLLHHMKRTNFLDVVRDLDVVYAGVSAGAIVLCPDVSYIADLDDRALAPDLKDTRGGGIVDFRILPHIDDVRVKSKLDRILSSWPDGMPLVKLTDAEAIAWRAGGWRIVSSPQGGLMRASQPEH